MKFPRSATIDWGDGTTDTFAPDFTDGGPGTATTGSFDGEHTYTAKPANTP